MTRRRTMTARRRAAADRDTRREALLVLLDRAQRGTTLTAAEAALLRAHVTAEITEADELRRTVGGQQTALQLSYDRTRAAEAAIVEAEQRADDAEQELAETEATALRWANYLVDAQRACGAPNWPALADTIRASVPEATRERARYRLAWSSARHRAAQARDDAPRP
ncbi:hypothetical protein ACFV0B_08995 [Streptomyces xanthophaeus]|uniref:hypothetical protein n=1 Tax=Streptomyces xanthophaeus TaxID=67385 RepID=UPI0036A0238A